ncbi:hypothetical protein SASPL_139995 [Salvia splendens]|uniref:RRM domain-containing protein n=1 Tax=Salvia splendens TaxID=180675 RepID=A0A8X8ZB72_SALSN|nr:uncharacterized protein LOC121768291 [Salvia splendens]XP_042020672.1 uncharacterized protein LOC121768291 [Salvia splendens]XP_042020673.1 uncharacterized protein LOC121768291 [Salvia splendens]XP_042020674.1 uncharacterized protein LOC121768291 [Salvia splendens]XP_042020675.1 uncharacterized protein LOC121768291 [Salvia splendens]KAG6398531.1 hypothetical protein SASPL_139995 [Salvia splendens]
MESTEEYDEFLKKVERTIYLDNISPAVTEPVLKAAIDQFAKVITVQFIHAYLQPNGIHAALVEVENRNQAETLINELESVPFMIGGMPRPVRAQAARIEMFADRPRKPGRRIQCRWVTNRDPQYDVAMKAQKLVKKHAEEVAFLLNEQVKEEEQLAKMQSHTLNAHHNKLKLIESISDEGKLRKLAQIYEIDI